LVSFRERALKLQGGSSTPSLHIPSGHKIPSSPFRQHRPCIETSEISFLHRSSRALAYACLSRHHYIMMLTPQTPSMTTSFCPECSQTWTCSSNLGCCSLPRSQTARRSSRSEQTHQSATAMTQAPLRTARYGEDAQILPVARPLALDHGAVLQFVVGADRQDVEAARGGDQNHRVALEIPADAFQS